MIFEVKEPLLIPEIIIYARSLPDTPLDKLEEMMMGRVGGNRCKILVDMKKDLIRGFVFATIEVFDGEDAVFVQAASVDPFCRDEADENQYLFDEFLGQVIKWARSKGLKNIYMATKREKAFRRRASFEYWSTIMRRKV